MKKTCINILILLFAGYCINFFSCDYPDGCHYHYSDENYDIKPLYLINLQDYEQLKIKYSYSDSLLSIYNNDKLVDSLIDGNSIDIVKYISYREEKTDSAITFYYSKKFNKYRLSSYFLNDISVPDSLSDEAQKYDYIQFITDRHLSKHLTLYEETLKQRLFNKRENFGQASRELLIDSLYVYVSSVYPNDIYAFSKKSLTRVIDYFYFDWGYNCYAININTKFDYNNEAVLIKEDKYGKLYAIPDLMNFTIKRRATLDVDGKYRYTGTIPGRDTLTNYRLYDDEHCFKHINKVIASAYYDGLLIF